MLLILLKILERAVPLLGFLKSSSLLAESQYGLWMHQFTKLTAALFFEDIIKEMNNLSLAGVVYPNFSKAFDTIRHLDPQGIFKNFYHTFLTILNLVL